MYFKPIFLPFQSCCRSHCEWLCECEYLHHRASLRAAFTADGAGGEWLRSGLVCVPGSGDLLRRTEGGIEAMLYCHWPPADGRRFVDLLVATLPSGIL